MKDIRKFLEKKNTAKDFTVEEVREFLKSDIEYMASELETVQKLQENKVVISQGEFYNLIVDLKQALDKLKEIEKNCECDCETCFDCEERRSGVIIEREEEK